MSERKYKAVFKRLETDREFRGRLGQWAPAFSGVFLDDWAWTERRVQRKIVEDVA